MYRGSERGHDLPGDTWPERSETRAFFLCRNHMLLSRLSSSLPLLGPSPAEFPGAPPWAVPPPSVYTPWAISGLQEPSTGNCCHPVSSRCSSAERQMLPPADARGTATRDIASMAHPLFLKACSPSQTLSAESHGYPPIARVSNLSAVPSGIRSSP